MLPSKYLIGIFMTSLWISCSFLFVTILCVHPSLWIDIIMIVIYLESYTLERTSISSWYPFLSRPPFLSHVISLVAPWKCVPWVRVISRCILMHSCVVKIFLLMLVLTRLFAILIGIPRLDEAFTFYLHHGLSQAWLLFHFLVSLCIHLVLVCVSGKVMPCTLYLIYLRLCWCLMLILTLVFSSAFSWLTQIFFGWAFS